LQQIIINTSDNEYTLACGDSKSFDYTQRVMLRGLTQALSQSKCESSDASIRTNQIIRKVSNAKAQP